MTTEIAESKPTSIQTHHSQSDQFMAVIQQAAASPDTNVEKMQQLFDLYKSVKAEEARILYNRAMSEAQAEMPTVEKRHWNDQTKSYYAKLEDVIRLIKPIWTKHGFSLSLYPAKESPEGFITILCDVSHSGGETRSFSYDSPIDDKGIKGSVNKTLTHGRASAFTYGERYLIGMIFALEVAFVGQDNDGNSAAPIERITEEQALGIHAMIEEHGLDSAKFHAWLRRSLKAESVSDIALQAYGAVIRQIEASIKAHRKENADS